MHLRIWYLIPTVVGIGGGLFLTLLSGLYAVHEPIIDAELMHFGFPFAWLNAGRSTWYKAPHDWVYSIFWPAFLADFTIYGLMSIAAFYFWTRTRSAREVRP